MHFNYLVEHVRNGEVVESSLEKNLIPAEGLAHILSVVCKGGSQVPTWYVSIFEGNYTPVTTNTAANFPGLSTECVAYAEVVRQTWDEGAIAAGTVDNAASKAEFTINATKTLYGCALSSVSSKGSTAGTLLSAVRFSTPKQAEAGDIIRITAPVSLTSA